MDRYEIIWKSIQKHGYYYDYREVKNSNVKDDNTFICPIHGRFNMQTQRHYRGAKCQKCKIDLIKKKLSCTTDDFINKVNQKFPNNTFIFSYVNYINLKIPIKMRCFVCGNEWDVSPESILHGNGCPKCGIKNRIDKRRMKKEDFIERSEMMHGVGRYLYDRSIILGWDYETEIYCTKCNVYFKQLVSNHLQGKGCPYCSESKLEKFVRNILNNNNIFYEYEAHFNWLGRQTIDFYLPKYHVGIECQGEQHFKRTDNRDFFNYESVLERDIRKFNLCMENKLNLFYLITDKINLSNELKKDGRLNEIYNNENILYKNNILNFIKNL